jgi:ComF family protein
MREAVHRFKYHGGTDCGAALGILLARHAAGVLPRADLVVPVPLARRRQRIRGYNQASLLAGHLAGTAAARLEADLLARTRETAVQADLSPGQRRHNLRGAVALRRPRSLEGLALLLVDDVYTTGATMEECSRVLKGAGATAVTGAVVACAALRDAGSGAVPDPPETGIMNS